MREVKEKSSLKARAVETLKSAPQAAFRRGTDASFQQLRQELRDAAQDGQPEELICFAEYNIGQEANRELCIGVYSSDEDDTKYYEPYQAERNTDYERNSAEAADD